MEKKKTPAKIFWLTKDAGINRILWYLILTALLSAFCFIKLHVWLLPYSVAFNETGVMTPGYFLYAAIGILFSTPGPFVAVLIHSLFIERTGLKFMMRNIFRTEKKLKTVLVTGAFCLMALVYALFCGTPNGSPWYMFILGLIVMIPFVGIAEEAGWRGVLQPELDKKLPYPVSVLLTAAIWCVWHYDAWIDPPLQRQLHRLCHHHLHLVICHGSHLQGHEKRLRLRLLPRLHRLHRCRLRLERSV